MKKTLSLILALALVAVMGVSAIACTAKQPAASAPTAAPTEEAAPADEAAPAEEAAPATVEPLINYALVETSEGTIYHGDPSTFDDDSYQKVIDAGVLNVGAEGNWSPFIYNDPDTQELLGIEVEVANSVSERLGVVNEWFVTPQWDGTLAGMDAGRYDSVYCGMNPGNQAYWGKYAFTRPYLVQDTVLVVPADSDIDEWTDLEGKGCANSLTSGYGIIVSEFGAEHVPSQSMAQAIELLVTGRADAHIQGRFAVVQFLKEKPDYEEKIKIALTYEYPDPAKTWFCGSYRIADASLTGAASMAIDQLLQDGTCYDIFTRYLGQDIADSNPWIIK